jgi:Tfp pilus assembly protein PilF
VNTIINKHSNTLTQSIWSGVRLSLCLASCLAATGCGSTSGFRSAQNEPATIQHVSLARLQERQGDTVAARQVYERVLESQPDQPLAHHRLGVLDAKKGDYAAAIAHLEIARTAGEPSAELLNDLGYACYLQGDLEQAEHWLRQASTLDSRNLSVHNNLGLVLGAAGRDKEALSEFRLAGSMADAYNNIAWVHSQRGDLTNARKNYLKALDTDSSLKPAAEALVALGNHEQAMNRIARRDRSEPGLIDPKQNPTQLAAHEAALAAQQIHHASEILSENQIAPAVYELPQGSPTLPEPGRLRKSAVQAAGFNQVKADKLDRRKSSPAGAASMAPKQATTKAATVKPIDSLIRRFDQPSSAGTTKPSIVIRRAESKPKPKPVESASFKKPAVTPEPSTMPVVRETAFWSSTPSAAATRPATAVSEPELPKPVPESLTATPSLNQTDGPRMQDWPTFR